MKPSGPENPFTLPLSLLKGKRYITVTIHPVQYDRNRLGSCDDLLAILTNCAVRIRGCDFPHVDSRTAVQVGDSVFCIPENNRYLEAWRFHSSGMFQHVALTHEEDPDFQRKLQRDCSKPKDAQFCYSWVNVIYCFCEYFEMARRLAAQGMYGDGVVIEVQFANSRHTALASSDLGLNTGHHVSPVFDVPPIKSVVGLGDIAAGSIAEAGKATMRFFKGFGWKVSPEVIDHHQREFFRLRMSDDCDRPPEVA